MRKYDNQWDALGPSDWTAFAKGWLAELRTLTPYTQTGMYYERVVWMNFTAHPKHQWAFILTAVLHAESDDELGHVAAGPIEHLLGWHGESYIDLVEQQAAQDPKFARTLTEVWKYKMTDEVWSRIQAIQKQVTDPLICSYNKNISA